MCVFVQTQTRIYNLIFLLHRIIMLPTWPWPCPVLCIIRERHVILGKAALHSGLYSCLAAASYIIMLYCLVYSFLKINVSIYIFFKNYNYYSFF